MKIKLITLGCPKNEVDSAYLKGGLQSSGAEISEDFDTAATILINTCGFIESAKEESIETILQAVALKKKGLCRKVIVTGCLSQRYGDTLLKEIPEIDAVFGNRNMPEIVHQIASRLDLRDGLLDEVRAREEAHYAYLKISEGCEHPCTFCAIPAIRGRFASKPIEKLVAEARMLVENGARELILIAQDTTIYGLDIYGEKKLPELLRALDRIEGLDWLRLMYAYPYHVSDELIDTMAALEKVCSYLDMPVQHVSDRMLKRMARRTTADKQHRLIEKLRERIPDLALRTSVIVGFPGETDRDFEALYEYIVAGHFDRLGVFVYSQEESTPASTFPDQIPEAVKRERQDLLIQAQEDVAEAKNERYMDRKLRIVVDTFDAAQGISRGRTEWDCPEIDQVVTVHGACVPGLFYCVHVDRTAAHELSASLC